MAGWVVVAGTLAGPTASDAQNPLTPDDYGRWERLAGFELDATGRWLATRIVRVDERLELRVRRTDGSGDEIVMADARGPRFSGDGAWLAYRKAAPREEAEAAEERIPDRFALLDLATGTDTVLFATSGFSFRDDGRWVAAHTISETDSVGGDLVVMDPRTGSQTVIGNVGTYAWQDGGPLLAATLETAWGGSNGVVLFDPDRGVLRTLASGDADYTALTWRDDSSQLAVLRSVTADEYEDVSHDVMVWADPASGGPTVLVVSDRDDVPADTRVTDYAGIRFGRDGETVFVGVRPWERADPEDVADGGADTRDVDASGAGGAGEPGADRDDAPGEGGDDGSTDDDVPEADVQVWHWDDDEILRAQEYRASQFARRTLAAAWHLDSDRFVVLGDDLDESVRIVAGGRWGIVADYDPFRVERRFGSGAADWYRVDVETGAREPVADALDFGVVSHEDEGRLLVYERDAWSAIDLEDGSRTRIEGSSFTRSLEDYDYPGPRPSWGVAGWIEGRAEALLYDEHDVWRADLATGSLARLTRGAEQGLRFRVLDPDPEASFGSVHLSADEPIWLSVFDLRSKASGYARMLPGDEPETLVFEDARVSGLTRAADSDRLALRMERWDDSPDVFVAGPDLDDLTQMTETNPFQDDFAWGRSELLHYTTDVGLDLQAILVYPADFTEGERYPLILYQYERLSDGLHSYDAPSERDYYNFQAWSQQGYFVLMPDIVYEPGRPGPSALDAVEHALDAAVATGHVDPEGMGLIGHSWGGYQASYLPTRTDRFAASVAGAAITNFLSFMGAVHWNGGLPETGHWETGQARMAVPYWEDLEGHLESSPANFIADLDTPMLLMHGDDDGVVDFYQGMEFYNYARRAGKEVVLLVYPGADHGLSDEPQQVDYHRRILEWFDHYLKGAPAADWITEGESWVDRADRIGR